MISLSRLAKAVYLVSLLLALSLLLEPTRSQAQYRGTPAIPTFFGINISGFLPNGGRLIGMPPPLLMPPLNNFLFDTTGSPLALLSGGIAVGGMGMGGGMMGMMGMGGGMMGMGGGMGGMGGGMMGMGGSMGGMGGMGGGMMGMGGGMGGLSMMGMGGGGMSGFAGKGMGGFNGRKAL